MNKLPFGLISAFALLILSSVFAAQQTRTSSNNNTKAIVLGVAQDGGIPQIGCNQNICRTQTHFVSSLAVQSGGSLILIDATPDLRTQHSELTRRNPQLAKKNLFDAVFLTHAHMGHYSGLLAFGKESVSTDHLPVHVSAEMKEYLVSNEPWAFLMRNGNVELKPFSANQPQRFGEVMITPLPVPHRKEFTDTHGFLIQGRSKTLLYIPDIDKWEPVEKSMRAWLKNAHYALLDGTFFSGNELPGRNMRLVPHPTIESSISFFDRLRPFASKIYFIHLNHTNPLLDPSTKESRAFTATQYQIARQWQEFDL